MAIQYYMRAFNTTLSQYVDWVVNDTPDSTGQFSGYPTNQLINITVNRIVQSKVANFLKQNQSLGGTDGLFFHVNSYDWRNAVTPISPPSSYTGFAVERGVNSVSAITAVSNTSPIVITTAVNHGLITGQLVTINGVSGNVGANGTWPIVVTGLTTFTLTGSTGTGTYTSGGNVFIPNDFSTLIWDELENVWRLVYNTNGDGTTLGTSQSLKVDNLIADGYIALGPDPADTGAIRLSNDTYIFSESNPSGTDVQLIGADSLNRIKLGVNPTDVVYDPGVLIVDGYIQHDGTGSDTAQTTGFIREKNNTDIVAFRGTGALAGADIVALASNSLNNVILGDAVNEGVLYRTSTGNLHQFQVNSSPVFEIGTAFARFTNDNTVVSPLISQSTSLTGSGQTLTLQAQDAAAGANIGGALVLKSGTSGSVGTGHGTVDITTGSDGLNPPKIRVFPTSNVSTNNNSILYGANLFRVDSAQTNPIFRQDAQTTTSGGNSYTIQAQDSILGSPSKGGDLYLVTGRGSAAVQDGYLFVQTGTGAVPQIVVSPIDLPAMSYPVSNGKVIITGNLEVQGTTTTIDSTIVDIIGQVIHANWSDPSVSSPTAIPTTNVGYSIHRGNTGAVPGVPRDGAAWIWAEPGDLESGADGYWRAITIPGDGNGSDPSFSYANSTNIVGVMGLDFSASSDPNPVNGYLASSGGLRVTNNVPAVVARNIALTTTIDALSNLVDLSSIPSNTLNVASTTGFSSSGTILIFSDAGPQTLTYTGTTGTTFTGVSAGTGVIHTGNYVAQTNKSTTTTAVQSLPTGSITVASTAGFPSSGILRIVSNVAAGSGTAQSVQTVAYTSIDATHFLGCTGGVGNTFVGGSVTSLPGGLTTLSQSFGTVDNILLETDFGNRIVHGSNANNTGHLFKTPSGFFYDFQVNDITQVKLAQGDIDVSGFAETIAIGPTVVNPRLIQTVRPDTGANNGFNLGIFAQAGQQQTGAVVNNDGGSLILSSGAAGTGGSGAAGIDGYVDIYTGPSLKMRVFPTDASPVGSSGDDNSIIYYESLFRVDSAESGAGPLTGTGIRFRQDDTAGATGQVYTIQAQNAATTGGNIVLTSGTGSVAAGAGNVQLQTGAVDRVVVYPTGSPANLPQGSSNLTYTEFRDSAQAIFVVPVSTGISTLGFASTVTGTQIAQVSTASTPSAPMTIQSQETTAASGQGGNLVLIGGNATGTTSTGGNVNIISGSGTSANGVVNVLIGGTQAIEFNNTDTDASGFSEVMTIASTIGTPRIFQASTGSASGQILALMAQSAATTGGPLQLHSGTGATNDGYINLTTGNTVKMTIFPTTAVSAADNNSILVFENKFRFDTAQTTPLIRQDDRTTASGTGETLTVQAQNETGATSTGGALVLTSGTGTTVAGNVQIKTGGTDRVVVHPTYTEFRDTAEALRITPVSAGTTEITFASTDLAVQINQTATGSTTGAIMTVAAQDASTIGGDLLLSSGTGATADGYVALQAGGVTTVYATTNQFIFNKGWRRHITQISSGSTYSVLDSDDYIAVTTLSAAFQINLPASPILGDTYEVKDATGNAVTFNITISGNGNNIDGAGTFVLTQAYAAATFTYTGTQWSVT